MGTRNLKEKKTMLAHNALSALGERPAFVLEHGDCATQQEDNGQKGTHSWKEMIALLIEPNCKSGV